MMKFKILFFLFIGATLFSCGPSDRPIQISQELDKDGLELVILGTIQDGGSPHIGCKKECCKDLWSHPDKSRKVVSLGLIDHDNHKRYMLEASPDFTTQLSHLNTRSDTPLDKMPDGIFLTHAHIGHYTGLMFLGREAKGAKEVPVYAMSRMSSFLQSNGPWDQLVNLKNIQLHTIEHRDTTVLSTNLSVIPIKVPHRDEYSETVGFIVKGNIKSALFIPDIDKWEKWDEDIIQWISLVDIAYLDATFYDGKEINNRDIREIPHPFIIESMKKFENLPPSEKSKVHFIHLNHTNPLLDSNSAAYKTTIANGFNVARFGDAITI